MCGVAQWFPRDKHDGAKTIALVLVSNDRHHCSPYTIVSADVHAAGLGTRRPRTMAQ
jgi:hypothetical protein